MRLGLIGLGLFATLVAPYVLAWGQIGHRVTGAIAEDYLSTEARVAVKALFPNASLAEISTYADENRSNPSEFWQKEAGPYHYVTVPDGKHYHEVGAPEQGDSYTALQKFRNIVLDESRPLPERRRALHFIVHIVGDLHQPLHVGNGKDRGGNDVKVSFFWSSSNLHRVWDSGLIDRVQLSYTEWHDWLTQKITPEQAAQWMEPDPLVWIKESQMLRAGVYPLASKDEKIKLTWHYLYEHRPTVNRRLSQGGVRIAAYLNEMFAK
ncbi:MAG: S1/P1 nuclease [Glaciecola sp.]|jgi:hypothetical protein